MQEIRAKYQFRQGDKFGVLLHHPHTKAASSHSPCRRVIIAPLLVDYKLGHSFDSLLNICLNHLHWKPTKHPFPLGNRDREKETLGFRATRADYSLDQLMQIQLNILFQINICPTAFHSQSRTASPTPSSSSSLSF